MNQLAISFQDVAKAFGRNRVLDGMTLAVPEGSVYALLGNNGAGKSTSMKLLTGQMLPDRGEIRVLGLDPARSATALRREIGVVSESPRLLNELTLPEYLNFLRGFYPDWNLTLQRDLTGRFRLPDTGKLGRFSRGMYAKAALVGALCRSPRLLVLDDPMLGLDTAARRDLLEILLTTLTEFDHTVVITSHILGELEGVCDTVGILNHGKLAVEAPLDELKREITQVSLPSPPPSPLPGEIARREALGRFRIVCRAPEPAIAAALAAVGITGAEFAPLNLEEIFLAYSAV